MCAMSLSRATTNIHDFMVYLHYFLYFERMNTHRQTFQPTKKRNIYLKQAQKKNIYKLLQLAKFVRISIKMRQCWGSHYSTIVDRILVVVSHWKSTSCKYIRIYWTNRKFYLEIGWKDRKSRRTENKLVIAKQIDR